MSELTFKLKERRNNPPTLWELKGKKIVPCPFCGGIEIHLVKDGWMNWCCCTGCGMEGPVREKRVHAVSIWQRRAT
ncbi:MAG: hypothetical protein COB71_02900 [Thiotrichales bacterium]|nr:MAG: hypothetical protein COB71_02900 [Thiotrichales bacterium]